MPPCTNCSMIIVTIRNAKNFIRPICKIHQDWHLLLIDIELFKRQYVYKTISLMVHLSCHMKVPNISYNDTSMQRSTLVNTYLKASFTTRFNDFMKCIFPFWVHSCHSFGSFMIFLYTKELIFWENDETFSLNLMPNNSSVWEK